MDSDDVFLTEDQRSARDLARRFATARVVPRAAEIDRDDEFPRDLYQEMADLGLLGLTTPEEYGGAGADDVRSSARTWSRTSPRADGSVSSR
jgi:alkylation response protein AidB-like acyl-CoA dehydrogenase